MKTNKKFGKIVSVVLALAMVLTLLPSGFLATSTTVKAVSVGDEMFSDYSSSWPTDYDVSDSSAQWKWGANQSTNGYSYGCALDYWGGSSNTATVSVNGYAAYSVSSMPAGTYTLTCEVDYVNISANGTTSYTTVYPYIGGSQITDYSISPYSSSDWTTTSGSASDSSFSYTFTLDEDQTSYVVGFYVAITRNQTVALTSWSLTCDSLSATEGYSISSVSEISGATVAVGASESNILSALASTVTVVSVNDDDDTDTYTEELDLTWDLSDVDTSTAGSYTASYSYTSAYVGTQTGTVTINVVDVSSDQAYKDIVTGSETATVSGEIEWASGNVPGTFESGTLGTSTVTSNGFFASSTSYVALNTDYYNGGSQSARMTVSSSNSNQGGGNNNQSGSYTLYYGATTSADTTYSSLTSATLSSGTTFTNYEYTFEATATTMYLHFATLASSQMGQSTYAYLRATMTDLTEGVTYTVSFYSTGYNQSSNSGNQGGMGGNNNSTYYVYIDDVTVTYEYEGTVDTTTRVYYDYAGSYTADTATVSIDATDDEVSAAVPAYVTATLVLEDSSYSDDEDYYTTQALPVEWDTSSVDTSTVGSYTITGTATYNGETIEVTTTVNVVEYGTIISSEDEGDFEDISLWETEIDVTDTSNYTLQVGSNSWAVAPTGTYALNVWGNYTNDVFYVVFTDSGDFTGATSGTYTYSLAYVGTNISVDIIACEDADDIAGTATVLGSIGALNNNPTGDTATWVTTSGSFDYSGDDITGDYPAIGLRITVTTGGGWGWLDTFNLSGPIYSGESNIETLTIPDDTEDAVIDSNFTTGWSVLEYATLVEDTTYPFAGYTGYLKNWYWDNTGYDSDEDGEIDTYYTEYDYATAYYRSCYYNLTAGTYTVTAVAAGENVTLYPMIYDKSTGTTTVLEDYGTEITGSWSEPQSISIEFELDEYSSVCVGVYLDTSTEGCWANVTGFSWYWGSERDTIWVDQPENGDFEYASLYPWLSDDEIANDTEEWTYGYTINQDASGVDGYSLNLWNNSGTDYTFEIYQYIQITNDEADTWYFDYSAIGENVSGALSMTATISGYDGDDDSVIAGDAEAEIEMTVPDNYYEWVEYVAGLEVENTTYLEGDGFSVDDDTVIKLTISITLGEYDYLSLDNIKFVSEDYEAEAKSYIAVDCFENGEFDDPWAVATYWSGTGDIDDSGDYLYAYGVGDELTQCGDGDDTNAVYYAYNNDQDASHEFTLTQYIEVTESGDYNITVDTRGYIYGSAVLYVYDADGNTIGSVSVAPSGKDSWTTVETGKLSIEGGQVITVVVVMTFDAATSGGQWDSDGDGTDDTDWYQKSSIQLDSFVFEEYVQISISGDGTYTPVTWTNSEDTTYYVNGGNYVKGVDISSIISEEAAGVEFTNDVFQMLKDEGVNSVRIRIWNNPYDTSGNQYGGGTNNADVAVMIAQRAADVGLSVMLSFHLSDFWADPSAQKVPKAWAGYSASVKATNAAAFVQETVEAVANTGADIQFVTIGNETTTSSGIAGTGSSTYLGEGSGSVSDMVTIMEAAAEAVRNVVIESNDDDNDNEFEIGKTIMVGVHVAPTSYGTSSIIYNVTNWVTADSNFLNYFDFFSTSVYPYWTSHGSTTNDMSAIAGQLKTFVTTYEKPVMVTEYNWPYVLGSDQDGSGYVEVTETGTSTDTDGAGNTFTQYTDGSYGYWNKWAVSRQGQADMISDLNEYFATYDGLSGEFIGTYYWEPTWISASNSNTSWSSSMVSLWYAYGCGVATIEGANYLGWSGYDTTYNLAAGSKTDEYTLFNANGSAASSLAALGYTEDTMPISEVYAQVSSESDGVVHLRIVGQLVLDLENGGSTDNYDSVGFKVEYTDGTQDKTIAAKDTGTLYTTLKENGTSVTPDDGYNYFFAYQYLNIPATGTYYFKVVTTAKGSASYQQYFKYYKLDNGTLTTIDAWDYPGTNADLKSDTYTTLYPSYIQ